MLMRYSHNLTHKTTKVPSSEYQKSKVEIKVYPTLVLYGFCSLLDIGMAGIGFWCKWLLYILFCLKCAHSHEFNTYYSSVQPTILVIKRHVPSLSYLRYFECKWESCQQIKPCFWINFLFICWTLIKL